MKHSLLPSVCGFALAAMSAAGLSHYSTVRQFVAAYEKNPPAAMVLTAPVPETPPALAPAVAQVASAETAKPATVSNQLSTAPQQKEFYESLINRLESLQNQNRDLLDQLAETNRDLMKLEFRVDTHSESFRPLPVSEPLQGASFDETTGVLPPRAEPVPPSDYE